jgi:ferredoxin
MADSSAKNEFNIDGKYYVDDQCIGCNACISEAETFFVMNEDEGVAFVAKQPQSDSDLELCENARAACPVDSIGNNG